MTPHYEDGTVTVFAGDCVDVMRGLPDASVDAVVTDPPYGLEFMGKEWDAPWRDERTDKRGVVDPRQWGGAQDSPNGGNAYSRSRIRTAANHYGGDSAAVGRQFQAWCTEWATEALRVLKPGGHLAAFGGTRTWHRLACAVEDAGFEIRDCLAWLYGSGFPKSLDVSKAIDKAAGAEREVVGVAVGAGSSNTESLGVFAPTYDATTPATDAARQWQGWGTALKPAYEPIVLARKPLVGTVAANVQAHGTGALNIDGCRVAGEPWQAHRATGLGSVKFFTEGETPEIDKEPHTLGRWPANVVLDADAAALVDAQSGNVGGGFGKRGAETSIGDEQGLFGIKATGETVGFDDSSGASRFFYTAKADQNERPKVDGVAHPTVKPLDLMRWLVRLVTPPGGVVLEPFAGSGTTAEACIIEGFRCIAIEREPDYLPLIVARLSKPIQPTLGGEA